MSKWKILTVIAVCAVALGCFTQNIDAQTNPTPTPRPAVKVEEGIPSTKVVILNVSDAAKIAAFRRTFQQALLDLGVPAETARKEAQSGNFNFVGGRLIGRITVLDE